MTPEDVEAALGQIRVPLLFVVGDTHRALAEAQRFSQTLPNAQLVILPGPVRYLPKRTRKR